MGGQVSKLPQTGGAKASLRRFKQRDGPEYFERTLPAQTYE